MKKSETKKVLKNSVWLTIGRFSTDIANLVLFVIISRFFGVEGVGVYSYSYAVAIILSAVLSLGFEDYSVRECSRLDRGEAAKLVRDLFGTQLLFLFPVVLVLYCYLNLTSADRDTIALTAILFTYHASIVFARPLFAPEISRQSMTSPAVLEVICNVFPAVVAILLIVYVEASLIASMIPVALGMVVFACCAGFSCYKHAGAPIPNLNVLMAIRQVKKTWVFAISWLVFYLFSRFPIIILNIASGAGAAGIYATVVKVFEVGLRPIYFLGVAFYPKLSKSYQDNVKSYIDSSRLYLLATLALGAGLVWGLYYIAPPLIPLLLGSEFKPAAELMEVFAVLGILGALDMAAQRILFSMNKQNTRVKIHVISTVLLVLLCALLVFDFGYVGIVASLLFSYIMITVLFMYCCYQLESVRNLNWMIVFVVLMLLTVVIIMNLISSFMPSTPYAAIVALVLVVLVLWYAKRMFVGVRRSVVDVGDDSTGS